MRAGVTLVELIVAITITGLLTGVVAWSLRAPAHAGRDGDHLRAALRKAIITRRRIGVIDTTGALVVLLPDGRMLGRSASGTPVQQ